MSLIASCRCGQSFQASPDLAGRTVACPACGSPLTVPKGAGAAPVSSSAAAPSGAGIRVQCACGQAMMAPAQLAGKQGRCPGCGATLAIPASSAPAAAAPSPFGSAPTPDPFGIGAPGAGAAADPFASPLGGAAWGSGAAPAPMSPFGTASGTPLFGGPAATRSSGKSGSKGLIVGLALGGVGLVAALVIGVIVFFAMRGGGGNDVAQNGDSGPPASPFPGGSGPGGMLPGGPTPASTGTAGPTPGTNPIAGAPTGAKGGGTQPASKAGWVQHSSSADRFSVSMPGLPRQMNQSLGGISTSMHVADMGPKGAFIVGVTRAPGSAANFNGDLALDSGVSAAVANVSGTITSKTTISLGKHPGRDVVFTGLAQGRTMRGHGRFYAVGNWIYQLLQVGPNNESAEPDVQEFFRSFRLDEGAWAADLAAAAAGGQNAAGGTLPGGALPGGGFPGAPPIAAPGVPMPGVPMPADPNAGRGGFLGPPPGFGAPRTPRTPRGTPQPGGMQPPRPR